MEKEPVIGIDLGGTNVRVGLVGEDEIVKLETRPVKSKGSAEEVLDQIFELIDLIGPSKASGIGMGVPGPVDEKNGIVHELVNIPAWKRVEARKIFEERYNMPLYIQNDANCFTLAEKYFGKGKGYESFIGLIVGTGMAGGIILDGKLYSGPNGMAGEFGMQVYKDKYFEYYSAGQFFSNFYGITGKEAYEKATQGDTEVLKMWKEFGTHLGNAIEAIMYAYDPQMIVLGGSVSKSFDLYEKHVWKVLEGFAFKNALNKFRLFASDLEDPGVLGAAALNYR